jgi:hypothetical protein
MGAEDVMVDGFQRAPFETGRAMDADTLATKAYLFSPCERATRWPFLTATVGRSRTGLRKV